MHKPVSRLMYLLLFLPMLSLGAGYYEPDQVPHEGVHYLLAKDRLTVTVKLTQKNGRKLLPDLSLEPVNTIKREGTVTVETYADPSRIYVLPLTPKASSDESMVITLTDTGLLKSINATSTGRSGTVLTNIFKFIGSVAGVFGNISAAPTGPTPQRSACAGDVDSRPISEQPNLIRYTLFWSQTACDAWEEAIATGQQVDTLKTQVQRTEGQLKDATGQALKDLQSRLETYRTQLTQHAKDRMAFLGVVTSESNRLKTQNKIDPAAKFTTHTLTFEIDELLTGRDVSTNTTKAAIETLIQDLPAAKRLFEKTGVVIELDPVPDGYEATQFSTGSSDPSNKKYCNLTLRHGDSGRTTAVNHCSSKLVFYRRPIYTLVRLYALDKDQAKVEPLNQASLPIIREESPHEFVKFNAQRWAKGSLKVTFDAKGVPTSVDWMAESSAAAVTGALATAIAAARDEYATTVNKLVEIKEARDKLDPEEQSELDKTLEKLKKEKELLDAQLALQGAQATFDSTLAQQTAAAELALVQSEIGVVAAAEARANQLAVLRLEAEVARVNKELELLKAKIELRALND